jgi:glutamate synthase domain-containing protein 2
LALILLDEVLKKKQEIIKLRSNLFDKDMNIKPWRAKELRFYDSKITLLEELKNSLQKTHILIITNTNILKRRTNASVEETAEAKRKKRAVRKNAQKSAKEKEKRFIAKVDEMLKLLTDGKFTQAMLKEREGISISLEDINQNCQLVARFHYEAMSYLIKEDYFETDALNFVNSLAKQVESKLTKSREINVMRKEKLASSKNQRTLPMLCQCL